MEIRFLPSFKQSYGKLHDTERARVDAALHLFAQNPFHRRLRNHKLSGSKEGVRSIRAGYDLRILFVAQNGHALVFLLTVGTHDEIY